MSAADVPGVWDVAINDHAYMVDTQFLEAYRSQTLDPIRRQGDSSASVGEATLNPEGYWRRSPNSWHKGAGQARYDAIDSDPERFFSSTGVDVWTEGQLSLLPATELVGTVPIPGSIVDAIFSYLRSYILDTTGTVTVLDRVDAPNTISVIRTFTGTDITAFDLFGSSAFIVDDGHLYTGTNAFITVNTPWITDDPTNIADVKAVGGRLFCVDTSGLVYDISATGLATLPSPLFDSNTNFLNVTTAGGYWYFASGSTVVKTTVNSAGTGLEVPTVAVEIPSGEIVNRIIGYVGFVLISTSVAGSTSALRLGVVSGDGSLTLGSRFAEELSPQTVAFRRGHWTFGQFMFLTAGQRAMRVDFSTVNDALELAYASDLNFGGVVPYAITSDLNGGFYGLGVLGQVYRTTANTVTSGTISMGEVSFGTREPKLFLDPVETTSANMTVSHSLTTPDGTVVTNADVATAEPAVTWTMTLFSTSVGTEQTAQYPILRALPAPSPIDIKTVPLLLHDRVEGRNGQIRYVDTDAELSFLQGLRSGGLVSFKNGGVTSQAQVIGVDWLASERSGDGVQWNGTAVVRLKVLS